MTRLVQLTTYPLKAPRHGGQLRCAAIRDRYRRLGIEVETIAVMREGLYRPSDRESNDIALPADSEFWDPAFPRFADVQTGLFLDGDPKYRERFLALLRRMRPDAIQLEQPWLYPTAARYLAEIGAAGAPKPRVIYSSQNIEWKLKLDERGDESRGDAAEEWIAKVRGLERELVSRSDVIIACTAEELVELQAMSDGRPAHCVVARNAISPFESDPARLASLKRRLVLDRYAMFVGSAHPPNADGFWKMMSPSLAFLKPDEKIVVAGAVGYLLRQHAVYRAWPGINEPRLQLLGECEAEDLRTLLHGADAILLPILTGGGSNLKTAEAIYTGRPVVATPHALRGYGDAGAWPTVNVAEAARDFRHAVRTILDEPFRPVPAEHADVRDRVTWDAALSPLDAALAECFDRSASADA